MKASLISRFNPAVPRRYLFALVGALWAAAGIVLCTRAAIWLDILSLSTEFMLGALSAGCAAGAYALFFSRIVRQNIARITVLPDPVCMFAFAPWRGYFMIAVMMTIGFMLRTTPIPKYYLAVPYATMGVILLIGSVSFYRQFAVALVRKQA